MAEFSPHAQAVIVAADQVFADGGTVCEAFAAALRALDSQLGHDVLGVRCVDCSQLQLIAAELKGTDG